MKQTNTILASLFLAAVIFAASGQMFHACGQNAAPAQPTSPEQQAAKVKEKWSKALNDARLDFQNSNDRESVDFVTKMLDSFERPEGMSPAALAADAGRIKARVRELVRRGALESAARLNWAQCAVLFPPGVDTEPVNPNHKTGGTPAPGGLVLYLPFDTPDENGVVHDASGAGNDGHVYGAKWVAEGKFGGAYYFSITNLTDRIVIPNSDLLNPGYITVSAWIKTTDTDGFWNRILDKGCDEKSYTLDLGGDWEGKHYRGCLVFELAGGAASGPPAGDGHWHHAAATYDGQVSKVYWDGVERGQNTAGHHGPISKNNWDLCIGNSVIDDGVGQFVAYDGLIDEVRIYNRSLSAEEIKLLATATQAGVDIVPAPLSDNSGKPDAAERLKKVKALYDQGLINKEDYDRKVKEIMDSL
jgi:hypothetical protein